MGERGPAKKPAATHRQNGTFKPSRHADGQLPVEIPTMPPDMPLQAQAVWNVVTQKLERAGLVADLDQLALRMLCESTWIYLQACDEVEQQGVTTEMTNAAGHTNKIENPAVKVRSKAWKEIVTMCRQFGMTPSARTGLFVDVKGDDADETADIIGFRIN